MGDSRDDFETFQDFCDLWAAASNSEQFKNAQPPKPQTSQIPSGFLNVDADEPSGEALEEEPLPDDPYWDFHSVSNEEGLIQEEKINKQKLLEAKTPEPAANPIFPDSIGKDQDYPNPVWTTTDAFKTIEELKRKLYDLECKVNEEDAGGKKWHAKPHVVENQKLWSKLESLRKEIDELSDTLGLKNEPNSHSPTWSFKS